MFQNINLYKEKKQSKIVLPFKQILTINVALILILFLYTIYVFYGYYKTEAELQKLKARQEKLNKGLVSVQQTIPTEEQKKQLQKQLTDLQQINDYRKKMHATLNQLNYQKTTGLSIYLIAMAEQPTNNLWLTKFHFESNGAQVSFEGITVDSSSIPEYVELLGKTKVFSNRSFEKLQISLDEQTKQTTFVISSKI